MTKRHSRTPNDDNDWRQEERYVSYADVYEWVRYIQHTKVYRVRIMVSVKYRPTDNSYIPICTVVVYRTQGDDWVTERQASLSFGRLGDVVTLPAAAVRLMATESVHLQGLDDDDEEAEDLAAPPYHTP